MMKQKLLKTMLLGLMVMLGTNVSWAGDFIDDASSIKVTQDGTVLEATTPTVGGKKVLNFTSKAYGSGEKNFFMEFAFNGKDLTPGQIFCVVECSANGSTGGDHRLRYLTVDDNDLEDSGNASMLSFTVDNNSVTIFSLLEKVNSTENKQILKYYTDNIDKASLSMTKATVYFRTAAPSTETVFNRIGLYTLGEILELYPSLKTNNWQLKNDYRLLNDACTAFGSAVSSSKTNNGTDNGVIETKNAAITTLAGTKLWLKAIDFAKIPANYQYFWFRFLQPADEVARTDLFADMNEDAILMLSMGTGNNNPHSTVNLPTMHKKLIDFDRGMQNTTFVDGVSPVSAATVDGKTLGKSTTANWATYSRELKAGYNSCLMPFKKITSVSDIPEGITFYKSASYSDGEITFTKMTDEQVVDNNAFTNGSNTWEPVIIHATTAGLYTFVGRDAITTTSTYSGYKEKRFGTTDLYFVGTFENECPMASGKAYENNTCYGIASNGTSVKKMNSTTKAPYYRAFIVDKSAAQQAHALTLSFDNGDGVTSIVNAEEVEGLGLIDNGVVYNLQGVRMNGDNLPRGIYVKNGKKFVVQ